MLLVDALPRSDMGDILLPAARIVDGQTETGTVTDDVVETIFANFVDLSVPLSSDDFDRLLANSTPLWRTNWDMWREQGVI